MAATIATGLLASQFLLLLCTAATATGPLNGAGDRSRWQRTAQAPVPVPGRPARTQIELTRERTAVAGKQKADSVPFPSPFPASSPTPFVHHGRSWDEKRKMPCRGWLVLATRPHKHTNHSKKADRAAPIAT
jgi:hypothetical protein